MSQSGNVERSAEPATSSLMRTPPRYTGVSAEVAPRIDAVDAAPRPPVSVIDSPTSVLKTSGAASPGRASSARRIVLPATPASSGADAGDTAGACTSTSLVVVG